MNNLESRPGLTLWMSGKSRPRNGKFRTLLLGRQASGAEPSPRRSPCSVARKSASRLGICGYRPRWRSRARTRVRHLMRSRLRYFAAVLPGPTVRIWLLTCGAKETRTPDPLLANNRQHVHPRPSPQVTVPERVSASLQIRTCCGTFLLYSSPWVRDGHTPRRHFVALHCREASQAHGGGDRAG
jgi:hypothetical protein